MERMLAYKVASTACFLRLQEHADQSSFIGLELFPDVWPYQKSPAHSDVVSVMKGQEAQNMEPNKCAGWHWYSLQDIPQPRFEPLEELISLLSAAGHQQDGRSSLFSGSIQVLTQYCPDLHF